jgi:hypothetical protein
MATALGEFRRSLRGTVQHLLPYGFESEQGQEYQRRIITLGKTLGTELRVKPDRLDFVDENKTLGPKSQKLFDDLLLWVEGLRFKQTA